MLQQQKAIPRLTTLPDELARRLRQAIQNGDLKAGEQLPTQHELAQTYGVSRPVVREAISLLKSEGLVTSHQGRGQFVSSDCSLIFRLQHSDDDAEDLALLLEFLMAVEVGATELAAERRTSADLHYIKIALDDLASAIDTGRPGIEEDISFHQAILKASHNHYFRKFSEFLESQVRRLIRVARISTARVEGLTREVQKEHEAIYGAIADGNKERARASAAAHLINAGKRMRLIEDDGNGAARLRPDRGTGRPE